MRYHLLSTPVNCFVDNFLHYYIILQNRRLPTLVELFGYIFYFGGLFLGPGFFYLDYKDFIEGNNLLRKENKDRNGSTNGLNKAEINSNVFEQVDLRSFPFFVYTKQK